MQFHAEQLEAAFNRNGPRPRATRNLSDELNKPAYTWHSSLNTQKLPNNCTRCRLYRAVAVGVLDQLRDTFNMVHACQVANAAERDVAIRRASGFNELFEAALNKESNEGQLDSGSGPFHRSPDQLKKLQKKWKQDHPPGLRVDPQSSLAKSKQQFGPEVEQLKTMLKVWGLDQAHRKWTYGVDLTGDDLKKMVRGADRRLQVPHSGYDADLPARRERSADSLDPATVDDVDEPVFDDVSPVTPIPDMAPDCLDLALANLEWYRPVIAESEPDPIIEAFENAAMKDRKLKMQDEVDQPASFGDDGPEFDPQTAFGPRRPWLGPHLPITLPAPILNIPDSPMNDIPNYVFIPDSDDSPSIGRDIPDHVYIPTSDDTILDHVYVPSSDEDRSAMDIYVPDHPPSHPDIIYIPDSDEISAPVLDHTLDMDHDIPSHVCMPHSDGSEPASEEGQYCADSDDRVNNQGSDDDEMSDVGDEQLSDPMDADAVMPGNRDGVHRDPHTGVFSAASFAHFTDDLLG